MGEIVQKCYGEKIKLEIWQTDMGLDLMNKRTAIILQKELGMNFQNLKTDEQREKEQNKQLMFLFLTIAIIGLTISILGVALGW